MKNNSHIYASVGTILVAALIVLLLLFFGMKFTKEERLEGLVVSFGEEIEGFGEPESLLEPTTTAPSALSEESLLTQAEESVALDEEQQKSEEELRAKERREAEEKRRQAEAEAAARNLVAGAFNNTGGTAEGVSTEESMAGNPIGEGVSNGHSWSLAGRNLIGNLPKPNYEKGNQEGIVVVEIRVDANGRITHMEIAQGTTISDENLRQAALKAAEKARFSAGKSVAIGKITYRFVLR